MQATLHRNESPTEKSFESWGVLEIMGHNRFAGLISEQTIGGTAFVRIDVPEVCSDDGTITLPAFTKLFGAGSIYAISPCTEETARAFVGKFRSRSFSLFEAPRLAAPAATRPQSDDDGYSANSFDVEDDDSMDDEDM